MNRKQQKFIAAVIQFLGFTLFIPLALIFQKQILGEKENFSPNFELACVLAAIGLFALIAVLLSIKDEDGRL